MNSSQGRLVGKVALVSGAARGMGEAFARTLAFEGAQVVLGDKLEGEGQAVADSLGAAAAFVPLDVTDRDMWARAVVTAVQRFGKLNVLVNNAGTRSSGVIGEYSGEQWDAIIATNLTGAFNGISAAVEALADAAPSSIVNISSTAGLVAYPAMAGYTASKFGVRGLTKATALDLARRGIRCNSVHPGAVETLMTEGLNLPRDHVAIGRLGRPQELARLVVFLASDESSYSTGGEFIADGGETAGRADQPSG